MKTIVLLLVGLTLVAAQVIVGGISPADKDDHHIKDLLSNHLNRLKTGDAGELKLLEIVSTSQQVVQGQLFRIQAKFQQGTQTVNCLVKIWEQAWLSGNDAVKIDAECGEPENKKSYSSS